MVVTVEQIYDEFNFRPAQSARHPQLPRLRRGVVEAAAGAHRARRRRQLRLQGLPRPRRQSGAAADVRRPPTASSPRTACSWPSRRGAAMTLGRLLRHLVAAAGRDRRQAHRLRERPGRRLAEPGAARRRRAVDAGGEWESGGGPRGALVAPPFVATEFYVGELTGGRGAPGADRRPRPERRLRAQLHRPWRPRPQVGRAACSPARTLRGADQRRLPAGGRRRLACLIGRFEVPGFESLAAALLDNPSGGAAAVWAPSGLTFTAQTATLDRAFLPYLLAGQSFRLRDALLGAAPGLSTSRPAASPRRWPSTTC